MMRSTFHPVYPQRANRCSVTPCLLIWLALALPAYAQISPEEHASHHPGQAGGGTAAPGVTLADEGSGSPASAPGAMTTGEAGPVPPAATGRADSTGGSSGMTGPSQGVGDRPPQGGGGGSPQGSGASPPEAAGGMGGMMEAMGAPPPRELYPTLMNMPEVTSERRTEILSQAEERMDSAVALLSEGLQRLAEAAENGNYAAMQDASAKMHEALARLDSGVAAQRALAEGQPSDIVALQWFKREMNLATPSVVKARSGLLGASPFHLFSMVLLVVFAFVMVALYFVKMRRAAALFGRIEANNEAPPPGAAPALAGGPPPPAATDKPAADAEGSST